MPTAQQWKNCGLIPTSGLAAWNMYEAGVSQNEAIYDYSGNGRTLSCSILGAPTLQANVINGQAGWLFGGAAEPLISPGITTIRHAFLLISCTDALFDEFRGVLSDTVAGFIRTGNTGSDNFFDTSASFGSTYRKTNVIYPNANQNAPVGGAFALIEVAIPLGAVFVNGIQIGQQEGFAARKHKGYFVEQLLYSSVKSQIDRERIMLYFNLKFAQQKVGLPFYFPSDDLMQFRRNRFYAEPPQFSKITDSFEFEDGGKTFNEVGDVAPRRWEYDYMNSTRDHIVIFGESYNQARLIHPFKFRDRDGVEHSDVRIESYSRTHDGHRSWKQDARFKLVKFPA